MATRLAVPDASVQEQIRDLAAAIADLHYVIGIVVENAKEFIPGESVEEFVTSWERSNESFGALVNSLVSLTGKQSRGRIPEAPKLSVTQLRENDLLGETGRAKRSTLSISLFDKTSISFRNRESFPLESNTALCPKCY